MKVSSNYTIAIFFVTFLSSCNSKISDKGKSITGKYDISDSIEKDIPAFFQSENWNKYFLSQRAALNSPSLENGYDSLQIRIWIDHGYLRYDSTQLLVITNDRVQTFGSLYKYTPPYDLAEDSTIRISGRFISLRPKKDWKTVIDSLMSLGIRSLPDYEKLKYDLDTDPYGVTVEVAVKNKYRIYYYPDYQIQAKKVPEAKKMLDIMKFLEREFDIKLVY